MKQDKTFIIFLFFLLSLSIFSCDLERDIIIELPPYENQLVVESYLEHGKPYRLLLSESVNYFDAPSLPIIANAEVRIVKPNGEIETLQFSPNIDFKTGKAYNFISDNLVDSTLKGTYTLEIDDGTRKAQAVTTFLAPPTFQDIQYRFNDKDLALLQVSFPDNDINRTNYYRLLINKDSLGGNEENDFIFEARFNTDDVVNLITVFKFSAGDTLVLSLYHLEEDYYEFLETAEDAAQANGNPFAQPGVVQDAVSGALGVFTALSFDRRKFILYRDSLQFLELP